MTDDAPQQNAWGISVGSLHWSTCGMSIRNGHCATYKNKTSKHIPASVLLSRMSGEPARLDCWAPSHPRGSAAAWPPEATVSHEIGSGRFPLAAAWTGRTADREWAWSIDGNRQLLTSLDAIATAATHLAKSHAQTASAAIVIPNDFKQREQQRVLDACNAANVNASLLWLPVAAALAWLDKYHATLPPPQSVNADKLILPVVHADWGHIRCSTLYLVCQESERGMRWMPARRRPDKSDKSIAGFGWKERTSCKRTDIEAVWQRLFVHVGREDQLSSTSFEPHILEQVAGWSVEQKSNQEVDRALSDHLHEIESPAAILFVGDFASQVATGPAVSRYLRSPANFRDPIASFIADALEGEDLLAKGAAIFARDRFQGKTSYLDTLPNLELFVDRNNQYEWLGLLGDADQFVTGGQQWELDKPIEGLAIRRGAASIKLVVAHDEHDGVRELQVRLDRPAESDLGAVLHVSATPAQGNARLRLVTAASGDIPSRSILANWDRMDRILDKFDAPVSKESYAQSRPRAYPNLRPRPADISRWGTFRYRATRFLAKVHGPKDVYSHFGDLGRLLDASRLALGRSAVSSEGSVPPGENQAIVDDLTDLLFAFVKNRSDKHISRIYDEAIKLLAFMSVNPAGFEKWISERLADCINIDETTCILAGNTIRSPKVAAMFVKKLLERIPYGNHNRLLSYQMQSLGRLLSQRQDVLSELPENHAYTLVNECLKVFTYETERNNLAWLFEHSGLVVVYALRYRIYSPTFLDPESELAIQAKRQFEVAIQKLTDRAYRRDNGFRDGTAVSSGRAGHLIAALQQLIHYIDRRGEGDILIAIDN